MNYTEKHFSRCAVNPLVKDLFQEYPDLIELTRDVKLLKYVICVYDPGSPFVLQVRDVMTRKQLAAQFAGFNLSTDEKFLDDVYRLKDKTARSVAMSYLKEKSFPREWMMIVANESTFIEYFDRMIEPISKATDVTAGNPAVKETDEMNAIEKKAKLSAHMDMLSERIEKGYRRMFGNDDAIDLPGSVGRTKPEDMAGQVG